MKSTNPRIEALKELITLEERRVTIQSELDELDQRISTVRNSVFTGSAVSTASATASSPKARAGGRPPGSKNAKPAVRGTYREYIMAALEAAGQAGVRVKDLALSMKTKPVNIHSWFHSNLKRIPSIEKITGGHYRIAPGAQASDAAPKAAPAAKIPKGRKGARRGALSAGIMDQLKSAGASGIKIADLADKIGAKYKNIYIWFATTGKKNPAIQRIAPATYRLGS